MTMICSRFEQLVQEVPQPEDRDRILAASSWEEHLSNCPACAAASQDDKLIRAAMESASLPQPSPGLASRILTAWSREREGMEQTVTVARKSAQPWREMLSGARQRMVLLATGLAACALLMLQSPLADSLFETGTVVAERPNEGVDKPQLIAAMRSLIHESELAEVTSEEMLKPIEELKDEFHPLGEKVSRGVAFLWKTIPADGSL